MSSPLACLRKALSNRVFLLTILMTTLVLTGIVNFVLVKVLFDAFKSGNETNTNDSSSGSDGSRFSFFVNQGVNFMYVIVGGLMVYPRMCCTNHITPEMRAIPQWKFGVMAVLDAFGTFFISMGTVYTPGQIQPLLNQALIPLTMMFSCFFLKERYGIWELCGASLILVGAAISVAPSIVDSSNDEKTRWYACVIYFLSNVPMAASGVYKEVAFREQTVDVWYLSQWVAIYQFLFSFVFIPLLAVPFIGGSENGTAFDEMWPEFRDGCLCWLTILDECAGNDNRGQLWLLPLYTFVNMLVQ